MNMVGADAEQLDRAASALSASADQLETESTSLHQVLKGVTWLGTIATRFLSMFEGQQQPQMRASAAFIRDAAASLRLQAAQQRRASAASTGALRPITAATAPTRTSRLDDAAFRKGLLTRADRMMSSATMQQRFPHGIALLQQWRDSFGDRVPTAQEAGQFERYLAALAMANYQYASVRDAAQMAFDQFTQMAKSADGAAKGLVGMAGGPSGTAETLLGGASDLLKGAVESKFIDPALGALGGMTATHFADVAAAGMDAQLAGMLAAAKGTTTVMHTNPIQLAYINYDAYSGKLANAQASSDIGDSLNILTGDGSVLDSALRTGIHLVPIFGQAVGGVLDVGAIAGSSAQAGYHYSAGTAALSAALGAASEFTRFSTQTLGL